MEILIFILVIFLGIIFLQLLVMVIFACLQLGVVWGAIWGTIWYFKNFFGAIASAGEESKNNFDTDYHAGDHSFHPGIFEYLVFNTSIILIFASAKESLACAVEAAGESWDKVVEGWEDVDEFLCWENPLALIKTAFFGSLAFSYLVYTCLTIIAFSIVILAVILVINLFYIVYSILKGLVFGVVNAIYFYVVSLLEETFGMSINWEETV